MKNIDDDEYQYVGIPMLKCMAVLNNNENAPALQHRNKLEALHDVVDGKVNEKIKMLKARTRRVNKMAGPNNAGYQGVVHGYPTVKVKSKPNPLSLMLLPI